MYSIGDIFFIVTLSIICTESGFMSTKYVTEINKILLCPNNNKMDLFIKNLRYEKINRTTKALSADAYIKSPMDENVGVEGLLEKWDNGKWNQMPLFPFTTNICNYFMKLARPMFNELLTLLKAPKKCPLAAGNYTLKNFIIDPSFKIPFWNGDFRFVLKGTRVDNKKPYLCFIIELKVTEVVN